jgi:hypothetical protein
MESRAPRLQAMSARKIKRRTLRRLGAWIALPW